MARSVIATSDSAFEVLERNPSGFTVPIGFMIPLQAGGTTTGAASAAGVTLQSGSFQRIDSGAGRVSNEARFSVGGLAASIEARKP